MKHDIECEMGTPFLRRGPVCCCAERAYQRDPLPEEERVIYPAPQPENAPFVSGWGTCIG